MSDAMMSDVSLPSRSLERRLEVRSVVGCQMFSRQLSLKLHSPFGDGIESNRGEETANVVRQFHQVFHKIMVTG